LLAWFLCLVLNEKDQTPKVYTNEHKTRLFSLSSLSFSLSLFTLQEKKRKKKVLQCEL